MFFIPSFRVSSSHVECFVIENRGFGVCVCVWGGPIVEYQSCTSPKTYYTDSSSLGELNQTGTTIVNLTTATPTIEVAVSFRLKQFLNDGDPYTKIVERRVLR